VQKIRSAPFCFVHVIFLASRPWDVSRPRFKAIPLHTYLPSNFNPNLVGIGCLECLQTLIIFNCENLENLCEDMQGLRRLRKLLIVECNRLISLPRSIKCLTTLEEFYINKYKKLDLMTIKKKKKEETILPLSLSLCIVIFDNLPSTIALPEQLFQGSTESLQTYIIRDCPNIGEMPDCIGNLNKLQNLEIRDCPSLSKRCRRVTGEDWPNIKHIRKIKVDRLAQDQIYP